MGFGKFGLDLGCLNEAVDSLEAVGDHSFSTNLVERARRPLDTAHHSRVLRLTHIRISSKMPKNVINGELGMKRFSAIGVAYRSIIIAAVLFANSTLLSMPIWGGSCPTTVYHIWGGYSYDCTLTSETFFNCSYGCVCIDC
jgi:hypothetical protein